MVYFFMEKNKKKSEQKILIEAEMKKNLLRRKIQKKNIKKLTNSQKGNINDLDVR